MAAGSAKINAADGIFGPPLQDFSSFLASNTIDTGKWGAPIPTKRRLRNACAAAFGLAATAFAGGEARVLDSPSFRVMGLIIVWGADATGGAPVVSDFIIDTNPSTANNAAASPDTDLIAGDVHTVVTGSLDPTADSLGGIPYRLRRANPSNGRVDSNRNGSLDAGDVFDAFRLRGNSEIDLFRTDLFTSFYVASNTAFNIDVVATPVAPTTAADLNRVRLRMDITLSGDDGLPFGSAAQHPHTAGGRGGIRGGNNRRLSNTLTPHNIFRGNQRTAASRGSIADQSVRFDMRYRLGRDTGYDLSDGVASVEAEVVYTLYAP
ncbi:MAG: hypothetical protein AAFX03_09665 [Pseudomonadota bacterium]